MSERGEWDAESFACGADTARGTVGQTAYLIVSAKKRADWKSPRSSVELIF